MKYCTCGYQTKENLRFCPRCGSKLTDGSLSESYSESFIEDDEKTVYAAPATSSERKVSLTKSGSSAEKVSLAKPKASAAVPPAPAPQPVQQVFVQPPAAQPQMQQPQQNAQGFAPSYGDGYSGQITQKNGRSDYSPTPKKIFITIAEFAAVAAMLFGAFVLYRQIDKPKTDTDSDTQSEVVSQESTVSSEPQPEPLEANDESLVLVPDVTGFSQETAAEILKKAGFECVIETAPTADYKENTVIEQTPKGEEKTSKGAQVKLVVAVKGSSTDTISTVSVDSSSKVDVPDVRNITFEEADKKLKAASLLAAVRSYEYSDTVADGCVISQDPSGGKADKNTKVMLVVSKGVDAANYVRLDNYVGMDINDVVSALQQSGLVVTYDYEDNDYYVRNSIIRQSQGKGASVQKGSTVSFVVSRGTKSQQTGSVLTDYKKPVFNNVSASSVRASEGSYNYVAKNALMADDTCWCEGASGGGVGEYFMLSSGSEQTVSGIQIKNGYTRDSTVFKNNGRIRRLTIEFSDGTACTAELDTEDMGLQTILFPETVKTTYIKMIIDEVKDGDKYQDTCVTLVMPY